MPPVGVTVSLVTVMQKIPTQECVSRGPGQKPRMRAGSVEVLTASVAGTNAEPDTLMERVLAPANLRRAYQRVSWHQQPRLRVATMSLGRVRDRLRALLRSVRARKMATVIERINPVLRGWAGYFKLSQSKGPVVELDGWVRHKLRCVIWRQWKRPSTRARNLMRLGLGEERACKSAFNGRGPWWNSGAPHMNQALPKKLWDRLGLVSILDTINRLSRMT